MLKIMLAIVMLIFSNISYSEDNVCPSPKDSSWERMSEKDFHPEQVEKSINLLKDYLNGQFEIAPEFIQQQMVIIEGGFLYFEMTKSKNKSSEYYPRAKSEFCEFMSNRALYVH